MWSVVKFDAMLCTPFATDPPCDVIMHFCYVICVLQNVQAQLVLWEDETRRVQQQQATYYAKFEDHELFNATLHTAQGHNTVLWYKQDPNPEASFIVIKRNGEGGDQGPGCRL